MNPIAIRLLNQQLIAPQYSNPPEVVSFMGAMQAQEYRMMRWAESCGKLGNFALSFNMLCDMIRSVILLNLCISTSFICTDSV